MFGKDWTALNKTGQEAILTFKHIPDIESIYRNSIGTQFRVLKIAHSEHDPWIEYENVKTKQHYNCKLGAFLDRFTVVAPYNPWLTR